MKKMIFSVAIALILAILVLGCGYPGYTIRFPIPRLRVYTNIPLHSATVKLVNDTPYWFEVGWDEEKLIRLLGPAEDVIIGFYAGQHAIVVKAWTEDSEEGKYVGATYKQIYVSGYERKSEVWIITPRDFQRW